MDLSRPQKFDRKDCLNWKFISSSPAVQYELFHVYFTSEI